MYKQNTHIHTLHLSQSPSSSQPLEPVHLMRVAFSSVFPLKLKLQSFSPQRLHCCLFGKWGRSSFPSEFPSHLHTTSVLSSSPTTQMMRLHQVPLHPLHNHQLNFSLYRTIKLKFMSCVISVVGDTVETERNLRRAEICRVSFRYH